MYDVAIIGAGASGIMSAIILAREGMTVAVLEANDRALKKVLITGNGRCNISNKNISPAMYNASGRALFEKVYEKFNNEQTLDFFRTIGVETIDLGEGKLYPYSLQAASVVNNMLDECARLGINIINNFTVLGISSSAKGGARHFSIYGEKDAKNKISARQLVVACGSKAGVKDKAFNKMDKALSSLGVKRTKMYPSLVQLRSDYSYLKHLNGTKFKTDASLLRDGKKLATFYGEVLFADYGLSGIPIMNLSSYVKDVDKASYEVELDLLYNYDFAKAFEVFSDRRDYLSHKTMEKYFVGVLPKSMIIPTLKDNAIDINMPASKLSDRDLKALINYLKHFRLDIVGTNPFTRAQVMSGGVDVTMINDDMSYKGIDGLYFAGEIVDVDGLCGGFNLQWAWSSAYVLANSILSKRNK